MMCVVLLVFFFLPNFLFFFFVYAAYIPYVFSFPLLCMYLYCNRVSLTFLYTTGSAYATKSQMRHSFV